MRTCSIFKIYLEEALKVWTWKCNELVIPIGDDIVYTVFFDDQIIVPSDHVDAIYMLRKPKDEAENGD